MTDFDLWTDELDAGCRLAWLAFESALLDNGGEG